MTASVASVAELACLLLWLVRDLAQLGPQAGMTNSHEHCHSMRSAANNRSIPPG